MAKETFSSLIDLFKTSSSNTVSTLVCDVCGNKLSVFRKKKPCVECKRQFCSQCLQRCRDRALRCKNCYVLTMRPPLRSALLDLRIKDLQHYLNQHNVSTRGCLEKEDLVNVLLRYASTPGYPPAGNSGNPPPGNLGHPPPGVSRNAAPVASRDPPSVNPGSQSGPSTTIPSFSPPSSARTSTLDETARHQPVAGDSDSSSDTSFEIVQRPSSNENIAYVHSSSSSTSVSGSGISHPSPTTPFASSPTAQSPVRETEAATTPEAPPAVQVSVEAVVTALASVSVSSQVGTESTVFVEASGGSDSSNSVLQDTLDVNSQPSVSQPSSSNNSPSLIRGTMASIASEADFEALSVKQLKDILHRHRVNYHGCCEKAELVERAKRLYRDYCTSRAELEKLDLDALCKICMDAPVECVMLECGHMATCTDCGRQLSECPICRQFVVRIVRTFKA